MKEDAGSVQIAGITTPLAMLKLLTEDGVVRLCHLSLSTHTYIHVYVYTLDACEYHQFIYLFVLL